MQFGDLLADGQAQAKPAGLVAKFLRRKIGIENPAEIFRRDTAALIGNLKSYPAGPALADRERHGAPGRRGIDGIRDQVDEEALDENGVGKE